MRPSTFKTLFKSYSTKANLTLLSRLRSETSCPLTLARTALINCDNDYDRALEMIKKEAAAKGVKQAAKFADRAANQVIRLEWKRND